MQQFRFNVVSAADADAEVPVSVAGQIMIDVQRLLTDVGDLMIRKELRTQNSLPEAMDARFGLTMQGAGPGVGAGGSEGALLDDALAAMCAELASATHSTTMPEESSNHIEAEGRRRIASDMLALADHLDGYVMTYGTDGAMRKFRMNNRGSLEAEASREISGMSGALIGVVSRDPARPHRWVISNGADAVQILFSPEASQEDVAAFAQSGPLIATGRVVLDADGKLTQIREVSDCYLFPLIKFRRIVTEKRDVVLLNPVVACPGYDRAKGLWTLSQEDIGIDVAKPTWDGAVLAFHDYLMFLWETYVESEGPFEGEEEELSGFLKSLAFPYRRFAHPFIMRAHPRPEHHAHDARPAPRGRRDRQRAHIQADRAGRGGGPRGEARQGAPLRGALSQDSHEVPRLDAEGLPLLRRVPRPAGPRRELHGQGRPPHGAHNLRMLRHDRAQTVHQGAVT